MRTITPRELTPTITNLFDPAKPTMLRAFNVLEGTTNGQILVDDAATPQWAIVRNVAYGTLYCGGQFTAPLIAAIVEHFRAEGDVGIGCWRDDPLDGMLPPDPAYDGATLIFSARPASARSALPELPAGYTLAIRDERLFAQSFDYASTLAAFGTAEHALRSTLGVVILRGDEVACEAATGAATHGQIEVGVTTAQGHRRKGLAAVACAKLVALCEARGFQTWWDCAKHNSASVRLARGLGYCTEREYHYVEWRTYQ